MSSTDTVAVQDAKARVARVFDQFAATYDRGDRPFYSTFGHRLADLAGVTSGASVLDVATGTGAVLLRAAELVGPLGSVLGVDLSRGMLDEATRESQRRGLRNVELREMDAEHLTFPDASFDFVLCGLALYFFPRHDQALAEFRRVLKPGGRLALTTLGHGFDERLNLLLELLQPFWPPGVPPPDLGISRFSRPAQLEEILREAGFTCVEVIEERVEEEVFWSFLASTFLLAVVHGVEKAGRPHLLDTFKAHLSPQLRETRHPGRFQPWVDVLFCLATRTGG